MKGYIGEEQQDILKGWEETDQNPMNFKIYVKKPQKACTEVVNRKPDLPRSKLPLKEHRRSASKPYLRVFDQNVLRADRHILQKYVSKESQRNVRTCQHQEESVIEASEQKMATGQLKVENAPVGMEFQLKENEEVRQQHNCLFSGGKSQKKYRRRFYAKTKLLDEPFPNSMEQINYRPRVASKFCSSKLEIEPIQSFFATEQLFAKRQNPQSRKVLAPKKKTFPVFFRELEGQQKEQQRLFFKKILDQKIRQRKHRSHFMISSGNPFSNSMQFGDKNIFPRRFL